jgi:hypothetical protein
MADSPVVSTLEMKFNLPDDDPAFQLPRPAGAALIALAEGPRYAEPLLAQQYEPRARSDNSLGGNYRQQELHRDLTSTLAPEAEDPASPVPLSPDWFRARDAEMQKIANAPGFVVPRPRFWPF